MSATAVLNLSKAGFTDEQVTALAEYFDEQMATKTDIAEIKREIEYVRRDIEQVRADLGRDIEQVRADLGRDIEQVRADLGRDIEQVRADLRHDIAAVRGDLELKISGVDAKIAEAKAETIKWVAGLLIAQGAAVVALIRFLPGMH